MKRVTFILLVAALFLVGCQQAVQITSPGDAEFIQESSKEVYGEMMPIGKVMTYDLKAGKAEEFLTTDKSIGRFSFSRDRKYFAYEVASTQPVQPETLAQPTIFVVDINRKKIVKVIQKAILASISPKNEVVYRPYSDDIGNGYELMAVKITSGKKHALGIRNTIDVNWSPDGKQIVYETENMYGFSEMYIRNYADTAKKGVPILRVERSSDMFINPHWSSKDDVIVFGWVLGYSKSEIYSIKPDGTGLHQLTNFNQASREIDLSSDGTNVLFSVTAIDGEDWRALYRMNIDGSDMQKIKGLTGQFDSFQWTP